MTIFKLTPYSQAKKPKTFAQYRFKSLTQDAIAAANDFILKMKDHYNFLPTYDFNATTRRSSSFLEGLSLSDFFSYL